MGGPSPASLATATLAPLFFQNPHLPQHRRVVPIDPLSGDLVAAKLDHHHKVDFHTSLSFPIKLCPTMSIAERASALRSDAR